MQQAQFLNVPPARTFLQCQNTGTLPQIWHFQSDSLVQRMLLPIVISPQFNRFRCLGSTRALALVLLFAERGEI